MKSRKILDCELFEAQSENNNKTYEFITSIHEIKLQDCEQRRRWDWEDVQAELFKVELKMQKLQQIQEAGSIFVNEIKNIIITVVAAAAVIDGQMTLGMMLAVQYIIGQLNYPLEQLMQFFYSIQDVRISLERINEIHRKKTEDGKPGLKVALDEPQKGIEMNDYQAVIDNLQNTLELPSIKMVPQIKEIKKEMMKLGFDGALMSGSGSCVFGITRNQEIMNKGYEFFRKRYFFVRKSKILNKEENL